MDSKLSNPYMNEQEDSDVAAQENIAESPPSSTIFNIDGLVTSSSTSSLKKRRAIQKRVVQIPIKETEGSRLKGESITPPSDSWAWRKYGQKPIKGSPYPRGYYRCSSSKGCPARKQVERSRMEPTMLVVTYSSEHNHPWPVSKNQHHNHNNNNHSSAAAAKPSKKPQPVEPDVVAEPVELELEPDEKFADLGREDELGWFGEMEATTATTSSALLKSPIFEEYDADVASVFLPMREEDESLFADLGELPEYSVVFRRGSLETAEERRRWCGTTS